MRKPADLVVPLHHFFRRMQVNYHQAEVTGLRNGGRTLETTTGDLSSDGLIIACGGRFIRKLPGIEHSITPCGGIEATRTMEARIQPVEFELTLQARGEPATVSVLGYELELLNVDPHPKQGLTLEPGNYVAEIKISEATPSHK